MIWVAVALMIVGLLVIRFAFSDKSDKYNHVTIGNSSVIMYIVFAGMILFIVGGMILNTKLGVYDCRWR